MKKIWTLISRIVLGALFLLALGIIALRLTGTVTYAVMSGSMLPALPVGSLVVVRSTDPATVRIGDVITYELPDRVVTHRVIAIEDDPAGRTFTTKGDANEVADLERMRFPQAVGLVQADVPVLGYVVVFGQAYWRLAGLLIAAAIFLGAGALLVFGRDQASTPRPVRIARAGTRRAAKRIASAHDELWAAHLRWVRDRSQELAA